MRRHLVEGDWSIAIRPYARVTTRNPGHHLQGLTAADQKGSSPAAILFRMGAWAEQMRLPTENAIRIGKHCRSRTQRGGGLGTLLVPHGGFLAAHCRPARPC